MKKYVCVFTSTLVCFGVMLGPAPASANLLANGSFEYAIPSSPGHVSYSGVGTVVGAGWVLSGTGGWNGPTATVIRDGGEWGSFYPPDGVQCVTLEDYDSSIPAISQTIATTPGLQYKVKFALRDHPWVPGTSVRLNLGGLEEKIKCPATWTYFERTILASSSSTTIRFTRVDGVPFIDDVSVVTPAVPSIQIPTATQAVTLDGSVDSVEWSDATAIDSSCIYMYGGFSVAVPNTVVYAKNDSTYLYVGVKCYESESGYPKASATRPTTDYLGDDDAVEVVLGAKPAPSSAYPDEYYEFVVNSEGVRARTYNEGPLDLPLFDSAVSVQSGVWMVEMRIPLTSAEISTSNPDIFFNFFRYRPPDMMGWYLPKFGHWVPLPVAQARLDGAKQSLTSPNTPTAPINAPTECPQIDIPSNPPSWWGTTAGQSYISNSVPAPWSAPVVTGSQVSLYDKNIVFGSSGLFSSVADNDGDLLTGPGEVILSVNGQPVQLSPVSLSVIGQGNTALVASTVSFAQGTLELRSIVDYDGFTVVKIRALGVTPQSIDKLSVRFPLTKSQAKFVVLDSDESVRGLTGSGWEGQASPVWLGGNDKGLSFDYDTPVFLSTHRRSQVQVIEESNRTWLQLNFVDGAGQVADSGHIFRFVLQPTPTKKPSLKKLGLYNGTSFWFEQWSDYQGYPDLAKMSQVQQFSSLAHSRNQLAILYFGNHLAENAPYFADYGDLFKSNSTNIEYVRNYDPGSGVPCWKICNRGPVGDLILDGVKQLRDQGSIDGIYLDSLSLPVVCNNAAHTWCNGSYPVTWTGGDYTPLVGTRQFLKRVRGLFDETAEPFRLIAHNQGYINVGTLSLMDGYYSGEHLSRYKRGYRFPLSTFAAGYSGRPWGWRTDLIPHPIFGTEEMRAWGLLHDGEVGDGPYGDCPGGAELENRIYGDFQDDATVTYYPYWKSQPHFRLISGEVLYSYYCKSGSAMLVVSNLASNDQNVTLDVSQLFPGAEITAKKIALNSGVVSETTISAYGGRVDLSIPTHLFAAVRFDTCVSYPVPSVADPSPSAISNGPVVFPVKFSETVIGFDSAGDIQVNSTGTAAAGSVSIRRNFALNTSFENPQILAASGHVSFFGVGTAIGDGWVLSGSGGSSGPSATVIRDGGEWGTFYAPDGLQFITLENYENSIPTISQTLTTVPGARYKVRFALMDHPYASGSSLTLNLGSLQETISCPSAWSSYERTITAASSSTTVSFTRVSGVPFVDNVSVTRDFVLNSSFESPQIPASPGHVSYAGVGTLVGSGWVISGSGGWNGPTATVIRDGGDWGSFYPPDGVQFASLENYDNSIPAMSQTIPTAAGAQYTVKFALMDHPYATGSSVKLNFGSLEETISCPATWTYYERTITASSSSTTLSFTRVSSVPFIDDVSVGSDGLWPYEVELSNITGDGLLGITVKSGSCVDLFGNANVAGSSARGAYVCNSAPVPTIGTPVPSATNNNPVVFPVVFSSPVVGFDSPTDVLVSATGTATAGYVTVTVRDCLPSNGGFECAQIPASPGHVSYCGVGTIVGCGWIISGTGGSSGPCATVIREGGEWGNFYPPEGYQFVSLENYENSLPAISQAIATIPGAQYVVRFALRDHPIITGSSVRVTFGSLDETVTCPSSWTYHERIITATASSTPLSFARVAGVPFIDAVAIIGDGRGPYDVTLSGISGEGTLRITIGASVCTGLTGLANTASSPSQTVTVDPNL